MVTSPTSRPVVPFIATICCCAIFTGICHITHSPVGTFFGGLIAVTLILPPLGLVVDGFVRRLVLALSAALVTSVVAAGGISFSQWIDCTVLMACYALAVVGVGSVLVLIRLPHAVASAVTTVIGLLWLSWPVWLSPVLATHQELANWLVPAHPPLTINGVLIDQAIWTERPLMYTWTALGQDVSYAMPNSIFWCAMVHAAVGLVLMSLAAFSSRIFQSESVAT